MITRTLTALALTAAPALAAEKLPAEIAAPDLTPVLTAHATGAQIYDCVAGTYGKLEWTFREPVANLTVDGKTVGHHYPGPSWQLVDGSTVTGKVAAKFPGVTGEDIAWLKLDVVAHGGTGQLDGVVAVQRINTRGGALTGECSQPGAQMAVPYAADYVFLMK